MNDSTIVEIPLDQLHESPFNPRKRFLGIAELAETMRPPNGRVLQPLLVRPRVPPLFAGDADLAATAATGFEVVFGHRRRRAAIEAGLATVPCMVKPMEDAEARHAQIVENLQRVDVHPFEEAEGFAALAKNDGLSADEIAEQFGKSRSYVYGRLKLLQASPEVRDACIDGHFGVETALLIARLGSLKIQQQALASVRSRIGNSHLVDGGKDSFRRVRNHLADKFSLGLKGAIFNIEDETLVPAAGACGPCPKRSGNSPIHEDVATEKGHPYAVRPVGPNVCTDVECFGAKKAAHLARKAAELGAAGGTVITGNKAKQLVGAIDGTLKPGCGYVALKDVQGQLKKANTAPEVVMVLDQRTGQAIKAVKVASLPAALQPKQDVTRGRSSGGRDWEAERREREAAVAAETERRKGLHDTLRDRMLAAAGSTAELRLIAWLVVKNSDGVAEERALARYGIKPRYGSDDFSWLEPFTADQLRTLLLDVVLETAVDVNYEPDDNKAFFEAVAAAYGVATEGTSTPSTAGAGADEAAARAGEEEREVGEDAVEGEASGEASPAAAGDNQKVERGAQAPRGARYWCAATGQTWSGKGKRPAWLMAAIAGGRNLSDFEVAAA